MGKSLEEQIHDLKDKLASQGIVPDASTPQEFSTHIKTELARLRKLVKSAGIKSSDG